MSNHNLNAGDLRARISELETQLLELRTQLAEAEVSELNPEIRPSTESAQGSPAPSTGIGWRWPLEPQEYTRYGRQMIMPEIGLQGQLALRKSSVLIIGVGGLGCPAAQYLAGAGVGTIGLVDGDVVDWSNLHRQVLHTTGRVRQLKVDSAMTSLCQLNPKVHYLTYPYHLNSTSAIATIQDYDLILDCTDNPASRYLVSDAAVLSGKPLVSGSALKTEGQLMVLNHPPSDLQTGTGGPCYRCVFPSPPPAESVVSCGEGGILGPVVGVVGVLMALEAIKLIVSGTFMLNGKLDVPCRNKAASMLLFSAYNITPFRQIRLRGKRPKCAACSTQHTISRELVTLGSLDYQTLCGVVSPLDILGHDERVEAKDLDHALQAEHQPCILLDVRDETQFGICNIKGSVNIPIFEIEAAAEQGVPTDRRESSSAIADLNDALQSAPANSPVYIMCRLGNDSQIAVRKLKALGHDNNGKRWIGDVKGGYRAWKQQVDPSWPEY
ncbi:Urmylation protein [Lambiella insularis]|nr:Urmylation protein [Lambiella insularis]